ncbi:uncharacterized protein TRAVEDRAFT_44210 [Trametes versicolor FP-101664 SS1]|uniref:uncharacterized protein n=1 Tax=Trametes versicolor (strain FP-101664) TaxID=717944 RepID=UPI0004623D25|nr:uncharacterized protein TRAVEDRAFT_44210 [Trametes versicolor FP-101664 SS1]EIW61395.1 hypothetical protein TRAVEDRAFT_44210 [Trametes versicolor FP-101664 SS1]
MHLHSGWVKRLPVPPGVSTSTRTNIPSTAGSGQSRAKSVAAGAPKPVPAREPSPARAPSPRPLTPPPTAAAAKGKRRQVQEPSLSPQPPSKRPRVEDVVDDGAEDPVPEPVEEPVQAPEHWLLQLLPLLDINDTQVPSKRQRIDKGYEGYYNDVRLVRRAMGEFVKIESAFTRGAEISASPERMAQLQPGVKYSRDCQLVDSWSVLQSMQPSLVECEDYFRANPDEAATLLTYMDAVANRTRSEDLCRLRDSVIKYSKPDRGVGDILAVKALRGFRHEHTARLLCPITKRELFEEDPETFRLRVINRDKTLLITAKDWPIFLYDENLFIIGHLKSGLLRSLLLVRCYKHTYTGPSSADREVELYATYKGTPSLSRKYKIDTVTPETIIYVAVLMRSALSSCATWADSDGSWSGPVFVRSLRRVFHMYPVWAENTLKWWRLQIYGDVDDQREDDVDSDCAADLIDREGDDVEYEEPTIRKHVITPAVKLTVMPAAKPVAADFQQGSSKDGMHSQPSDDD